MLVAENAEPEVVSIGYIDEVVVAEEPIGSNGPAGLRFFLCGNVKRVVRECGQDIGTELFLIHNHCCTENGVQQSRCAERDGNLLLRKHWAEIARIDGSIVAISPFGVDVPASSERVGFGT